jgi:hypothetical protein
MKKIKNGGVAQMVSAMVCQAIGRGFKSRHSRLCVGFSPSESHKWVKTIHALFTKNLMGLSLALLERVQAV